MQPGREAPRDAAVFTPIYIPSVGQGCACKCRTHLIGMGPGKTVWRDSKAVVENTGSVMHQTLDILLHFFIHSLQGEFFRCLFLPACSVNHSTTPQPSPESEADLTMDTHLNREVTGQLLFVCLNGTPLCYFFFAPVKQNKPFFFFVYMRWKNILILTFR